jgi:hypothetical protein
MGDEFVFWAPKCRNPENFIKIKALLESGFVRFLQFSYLHLWKAFTRLIVASDFFPPSMLRAQFICT